MQKFMLSWKKVLQIKRFLWLGKYLLVCGEFEFEIFLSNVDFKHQLYNSISS